MVEEAEDMTLADMLDKLERGRIGHSEAMRWLGVDNYAALVEVVHANGRQMPGHRAGPVTAETRALLRLIAKPVAVKGLVVPA
jgi:hypothetical protein